MTWTYYKRWGNNEGDGPFDPVVVVAVYRTNRGRLQIFDGAIPAWVPCALPHTRIDMDVMYDRIDEAEALVLLTKIDGSDPG